MCKWNKWGDTRIDPCMKPIIKTLKSVHFTILSCCCGHDKYPMTVIVKGNISGIIYELFSGLTIPRKKRFYKKDKEGYYYIPEVIKYFSALGILTQQLIKEMKT